MDTPKVLASREEHAVAVERLTSLLDAKTRDDLVRDEIKLLSVLIEEYERRTVTPLDLPSPLDAILFRMEQQGLTPRDLIPYLGSASRVSEVLSGKRGLSISMIRALHEGLGISAEVLIRPTEDREKRTSVRPKGDVAEVMKHRGWLSTTRPDAVMAYLQPARNLRTATAFRRTEGHSIVDENAILAWTARIYHAAKARSAHAAIVTTNYDVLLREVIKLSWADEGPRLAIDFLGRHGVPVIVEPQLPKTQLDGVAIREADFVAIGLTLRFDRLDSFWFTLAHELAHLIGSEGRQQELFLDDLEAPASGEDERQADAIAREYLIPRDKWARSPASRLRSPQAVEHLARELRIHPAIVAGRVRFESHSFRVLSNMIGSGEVRRLFPEVKWND